MRLRPLLRLFALLCFDGVASYLDSIIGAKLLVLDSCGRMGFFIIPGLDACFVGDDLDLGCDLSACDVAWVDLTDRKLSSSATERTRISSFIGPYKQTPKPPKRPKPAPVSLNSEETGKHGT